MKLQIRAEANGVDPLVSSSAHILFSHPIHYTSRPFCGTHCHSARFGLYSRYLQTGFEAQRARASGFFYFAPAADVI